MASPFKSAAARPPGSAGAVSFSAMGTANPNNRGAFMQNMDQIRAANAVGAADRVEKKNVTKLPALIVNNGLLAAAAFCRDKGEGLLSAMNAVAEHSRSARRQIKRVILEPTPTGLPREYR